MPDITEDSDDLVLKILCLLNMLVVTWNPNIPLCTTTPRFLNLCHPTNLIQNLIHSS